jgi:hypothetical protein
LRYQRLVGERCALYRAVVGADLEGIVAKRLAEAHHPTLARWHKVLNWGYSQRRGRAPNGFASAAGAMLDDNESGSDRVPLQITECWSPHSRIATKILARFTSDGAALLAWPSAAARSGQK